jgi:hypothetical protein
MVGVRKVSVGLVDQHLLYPDYKQTSAGRVEVRFDEVSAPGISPPGVQVITVEVKGKVRKYYTITDGGREALAEARLKIEELVAEVLEGQGPETISELDDQDAEEV